MKRWFSILLAAMMLLGLTACRTGQDPVNTSQESSESVGNEESGTQTAQTGTEPTESAAPRSPRVLPTAASYHEIYERFKASMGDRWAYSGGIEKGEVAVEEEAEMSVEKPTEDAGFDEAMAEPNDAGMDLGYSGTNVQVQGIDEGDIIKTDGRFIYVLHDYQMVYIFSVDGAQVEKVSTIDLSKDQADSWEWTSEIFIVGDRLAVISNTDGWVYEVYDEGEDKETEDQYSKNRETSRIRVYDITDRTAPKLLTVLEQNGNYRSARLIDDRLYMVSDYGIYYDFEEDEPITFIPRYFINGKGTLLEPGQIICPEETDSRAYTVVGVFDLTEGDVLQCQSYLGYAGTIYMNQNSLYLANSNYKDIVTDTWEESIYTVEQHSTGLVTQVTRYDVGEDGLLTYVADGEVPGSIYGQFALDEADGFLRIVTTGSPGENYQLYIDPERGFENRRWEDETIWVENAQTNALYILNEQLEQVGSLTDLAPGERVYSVRYNGDIAYFCTFRQVDPLFAVDVSDPEAPKQLSALKIPGFSEYLHVYGDGRLFGLGQEADETTGGTEGLKLTMFDTSDPENVTVLHTTLPKGWSSYAEYDHKAILVDPGKNLIGFDLSDENGSRYVLYGYSDENGFELKGQIEMNEYYGEARGLYIGDYYYIVAENEISIINLMTLDLEAVVTF